MSSSTTTTRQEGTGRTAKTIGYYGAFVALGMAGAALGPTLPALAAQTHARLSQVSFVLTASALGYLIGSYQGGRLYDRVPGHPVLVAVLLAMGAMLALVPLVPLVWLLVGVYLILGCAEGALAVAHDQQAAHAEVFAARVQLGEEGGVAGLVLVERVDVFDGVNAVVLFRGLGEVDGFELAFAVRAVQRPLSEGDLEGRFLPAGGAGGILRE